MFVDRGFALLMIAIVLFWSTVPPVRAQNAGARREFPPGLARRADLPQSRLRAQIQNLPAPARDRAMAWLSKFHFTEQDIPSLHADSEGAIFYADEFKPDPAPAAAAPATEPTTAAAAVPVSPFPAHLNFHSKPGAPNVIYLNFGGESVQGTAWNTWLNRATIPAVPFSADSDRTTFNDAEQHSIRRIWQRVAEDYAPFNVDVTTERPATFTMRTAHALITRHTDANNSPNPSSGAGGVAYVAAFATAGYASYRPAWIYDNNVNAEESHIAEIVSHEIAHNLGLSHDGTTDGIEYYSGHGSGSGSWGPLMGASYGRNVTQWSKGEYHHASNTQDDLATLADKLTYRTDDHANTLASATSLNVGANGAIISTTPETNPSDTTGPNKGILERNTDVDWFSFHSGSGTASLTVNPWINADAMSRGGNVDLHIELYDSAGLVLLTNNSSTLTTATIQTNLLEGKYYLAIRNTGAGSPFASQPTGYTSYGGVGQYFISGFVVPSGAVMPPRAYFYATDVNESAATSHLIRITYTDNLTIDRATIDNNDLLVTGPNGFLQRATLVSVDPNANAPSIVATYSIAPPDLAWTENENGVYTVTLLANAVGDTEGAFVPARQLGQFNAVTGAHHHDQSLIIASTLTSNRDLTLTFPSTPGLLCTLESTIDFQTWTEVESQVADGSSITFTTSGSDDARFYRIKR